MDVGEIYRHGKMSWKNRPGALQALGPLALLSHVNSPNAPMLGENRDLDKREILTYSL